MNVVVTGASRGIGLELVNQAISRNDRVLAVARSPSPELKTIQAPSSGRLEIAEVDVADPETGAKIAMVLAAWPRIDLLLTLRATGCRGDRLLLGRAADGAVGRERGVDRGEQLLLFSRSKLVPYGVVVL